eukprot:1451740-Rhodomonas_salina.1
MWNAAQPSNPYSWVCPEWRHPGAVGHMGQYATGAPPGREHSHDVGQLMTHVDPAFAQGAYAGNWNEHHGVRVRGGGGGFVVDDAMTGTCAMGAAATTRNR